MSVGARLRVFTEAVLSRRKARIIQRRQRQISRSPVRDVFEIIFVALLALFLLNQYLIQGYRIPSSSMEPELLVGDRIFVGKFYYGVEILPGLHRLPAPADLHRGDPVAFRNPEYYTGTPAHALLRGLIKIFSLSLLDIDGKPGPEDPPDLLIKRAAGLGGDRLRYLNGETLILNAGASVWRSTDYPAGDSSFIVHRLAAAEGYPLMRRAAMYSAWIHSNSDYHRDELAGLLSDAEGSVQALRLWNGVDHSLGQTYDALEYQNLRIESALAMNPGSGVLRNAYIDASAGWYVAEDQFLPLGDNRDNSRDGRFFGSVPRKDLIGKALFKYWPPGRIGIIK